MISNPVDEKSEDIELLRLRAKAKTKAMEMEQEDAPEIDDEPIEDAEEDTPSVIDSVGVGAMGVAHGATLGFLDELYGLARSLDPDITYEEARDDARDYIEGIQHESPVSFLMGEIVAPNPLSAVSKMPKALALGKKIKSIMQSTKGVRVAAPVAGEIAEGAIATAGESRSLSPEEIAAGGVISGVAAKGMKKIGGFMSEPGLTEARIMGLKASDVRNKLSFYKTADDYIKEQKATIDRLDSMDLFRKAGTGKFDTKTGKIISDLKDKRYTIGKPSQKDIELRMQSVVDESSNEIDRILDDSIIKRDFPEIYQMEPEKYKKISVKRGDVEKHIEWDKTGTMIERSGDVTPVEYREFYETYEVTDALKKKIQKDPMVEHWTGFKGVLDQLEADLSDYGVRSEEMSTGYMKAINFIRKRYGMPSAEVSQAQPIQLAFTMKDYHEIKKQLYKMTEDAYKDASPNAGYIQGLQDISIMLKNKIDNSVKGEKIKRLNQAMHDVYQFKGALKEKVAQSAMESQKVTSLSNIIGDITHAVKEGTALERAAMGRGRFLEDTPQAFQDVMGMRRSIPSLLGSGIATQVYIPRDTASVIDDPGHVVSVLEKEAPEMLPEFQKAMASVRKTEQFLDMMMKFRPDLFEPGQHDSLRDGKIIDPVEKSMHRESIMESDELPLAEKIRMIHRFNKTGMPS